MRASKSGYVSVPSNGSGCIGDGRTDRAKRRTFDRGRAGSYGRDAPLTRTLNLDEIRQLAVADVSAVPHLGEFAPPSRSRGVVDPLDTRRHLPWHRPDAVTARPEFGCARPGLAAGYCALRCKMDNGDRHIGRGDWGSGIRDGRGLLRASCGHDIGRGIPEAQPVVATRRASL